MVKLNASFKDRGAAVLVTALRGLGIQRAIEDSSRNAGIMPVGNGTLLLGAYRGFQKLHRVGLIPHLPRLFAVQSAACAPIYQAFQNGERRSKR